MFSEKTLEFLLIGFLAMMLFLVCKGHVPPPTGLNILSHLHPDLPVWANSFRAYGAVSARISTPSREHRACRGPPGLRRKEEGFCEVFLARLRCPCSRRPPQHAKTARAGDPGGARAGQNAKVVP